MTLTHAEKQLILLTKGHFKHLDEMSFNSKLQHLTAYQFDLPVWTINTNDIYNFVVDVYIELKKMGAIALTEERLLKKDLFGYMKTSITKEDVMRELISEIQGTQTGKFNIELGEADFSLFEKEKTENDG